MNVGEVNYQAQPTELEAQGLHDIQLMPGMTAEQYAHTVTSVQYDWRHLSGKRTTIFIREVNEGFNELIQRQPLEDILSAQAVLTDYGKRLKESDYYDEGIYLSWINKVRKLANFTDRLNTTRGYNRQYSSGDVEQEPYSTEKFWQEIYLDTAEEDSSTQAYQMYIFGPKVEDKDTGILVDVVERLQSERLEDIFTGTSLISKNPSKLIRVGFDCFRSLVREAAEAGWYNANAVAKLIDETYKPGMPLHSVLISVGNQVAHALNSKNAMPGDAKLEKLNIYDPKLAAEAINRCSYLMFELGNDPEGHDPLNLTLYSQILGELFIAAERILREKH